MKEATRTNTVATSLAESIRREGKFTRRGFIRLTGIGLGVTGLSGLLVACGDEPEDDDTPDDDDTVAAVEEDDETEVDEVEDDAEVELDDDDDGEVEDEDASERYGGILRNGFDTAPLGFDPHAATNFASLNVYENVYDSLFEINEDLELVPTLCESFEIIDEVTYQFDIRQGVTFHDGKQLTAHDVKYSFERMIDPANAFPRVQWFGRIETIEVDDDYTVTMTLGEPFAPVISYMGMQGAAIVDQDMVDEHGDLMSVESANGTGPFMLTSYEPDREARLVRFEDHWRDGLPYVDEVQWLIMTDEPSRMAGMRANEIDFTIVFDVQNAQVMREEFPMVEGLVTARALGIINCRNEPLDDQRVRQALAYAIDRQEFIDGAMLGEAEPVGFVPASDPVAVPTDEFDTFTQDLDRARELLEEAGYGDGFTIRLNVSPEYAMDVANAEILQSQLRELNIDVEIQQLEWGNLLDNMRNERDFDMLHIIFTFQADPDGYMYQYFHTDSGDNHSGISEPELDDLIEQGRTTVDEDERAEIYAELQRRLADEWVPKLTYFSYNNFFPHQERVRDWSMSPAITYRGIRHTWLADD